MKVKEECKSFKEVISKIKEISKYRDYDVDLNELSKFNSDSLTPGNYAKAIFTLYKNGEKCEKKLNISVFNSGSLLNKFYIDYFFL